MSEGSLCDVLGKWEKFEILSMKYEKVSEIYMMVGFNALWILQFL